MRLRTLLVPLLAAAGVVAAGRAAAESVALLPVRQGVRLEGIGARLEELVAAELGRRLTVVDAERTRAALRAERLRNADTAPPERLRAIAESLGADWLVSAAVHDAPELPTPDVTISARLYEGRTGRLARAVTVARSGLDGRGMLGIGGIGELENLLPPAVVELLDTLALGARGASETTGERVGLVPFTVNEVDDGLEVAAAATETMRSILAAAGVPLAEPGCVASALRGPSGIRWGELAEETRVTLRQSCGAVRLVTGSVERWEIRGGVTPEPVVAVAVRLLDAATGRILFVGSLEAGGWDHEGWFGLGRVHSRGTHLRNLLERIATRMLRADAGAESAEVMKESS